MEKIERLFGDYSIVLVSDFIPSDYSLEKISEIIDGALKKIQKYDYDRNNDIVKFEIGDIITYIGKERIIFQHTKENESELLNYVNSFCRVLGEKIIKSYGYNYNMYYYLEDNYFRECMEKITPFFDLAEKNDDNYANKNGTKIHVYTKKNNDSGSYSTDVETYYNDGFDRHGFLISCNNHFILEPEVEKAGILINTIINNFTKEMDKIKNIHKNIISIEDEKNV